MAAAPVAQDPAELRGAVLAGQGTGVQIDLEDESHPVILAGTAATRASRGGAAAAGPAAGAGRVSRQPATRASTSHRPGTGDHRLSCGRRQKARTRSL